MKRIRNIGGLLNPLSIHLKGGFGKNDSIVKLPEGMEMWTSMELDRYSTLIYSKKRLILVEEVDKPEGANENESYPIGYFNSEGGEAPYKDAGVSESKTNDNAGFGEVVNENGEIRFVKNETDATNQRDDKPEKEEVPQAIIDSLINDSIERSRLEGIIASEEKDVSQDELHPMLPYVKAPYDPNDYDAEDDGSPVTSDYENEKKEVVSNVDTRKKWTEEEEDILRKGYPKNGLPYCLKKLPHRSRKSIEKKIQSMQLRLEKKKK